MSAGEEYVARQAATVGRCAPPRTHAPPWVPRLANAEGQCLGFVKGTGTYGAGSVVVLRDGRTLACGHPDGRVRRWDLRSGGILWQAESPHTDNVLDIAPSPDGPRLVTGSWDNTVAIWDAHTGARLARGDGHTNLVWRVAWSPDGTRVASASSDGSVRVWDAASGSLLVRTGTTHSMSGVSWSPDGERLASASLDRTVRLWRAGTGESLQRLQGHDAGVNAVRWSPDGRALASASEDKTVAVWDIETGRVRLRLRGHTEQVNSVAWSPDGRLLASAGDGEGSVRVWDAASGQELARFDAPEDFALRIAWSPDGAFLASSHFGNIFRLWDTRRWLDPARQAPPLAAQAPLPRELAGLPSALSSVVRCGCAAPLSLVRELLHLIAGRAPEDARLTELAHHPGIRHLRELRWPASARVGLLPPLLHGLALDEWKCAPELAPSGLRQGLHAALSGAPMAPAPVELPVLGLMQRADRIDDRWLTLLETLGPEAVARDPGLPLRLLPRVAALRPLDRRRRRLLGARLHDGHDGHTQGYGGSGERAGLCQRGDLRALLGSQWALPPELRHYRSLRGELLYRAREGQDVPRLRPAVLLLDVSPATFGPVEALTRLGAHVLARSLLEAGLKVVLLTAGGAGELRFIERPADLVELWTLRTLKPAEPVSSLKRAGALRDSLYDGTLEPVVLLLSHAYFGAEDELPQVRRVRGLFVQYPGQNVRPPSAGSCERWHTLAAGAITDLAPMLGLLMG